MTDKKDIIPASLKRWEKAGLVFLVAACLVLAFLAKDRRQKAQYRGFLKVAPMVAAALEDYARAHGGRFPPDSMGLKPPQGWDAARLAWRREWKIDYEVHPNGSGGFFVCLEFGGPFKHRRYFALCRKPALRKKYGQGQPIPGQKNRIWLIRESARIMPKTGG